jgi:hypothetical protein
MSLKSQDSRWTTQLTLRIARCGETPISRNCYNRNAPSILPLRITWFKSQNSTMSTIEVTASGRSVFVFLPNMISSVCTVSRYRSVFVEQLRLLRNDRDSIRKLITIKIRRRGDIAGGIGSSARSQKSDRSDNLTCFVVASGLSGWLC